MLKVVIDANVWVSSLYSDGKPRRIRERFELGQFKLFLSEELLDECKEVLARPKLAQRISSIQAAKVLEIIRKRATFIQLPRLIPSVCRDPDDDAYLLCAQIAGCNFLVSGDPHLLELQEHGRMKIITPAQFLQILEQQP